MKGLPRINAMLPQLSPSDRLIAQFLLEHPEQVKLFSSPELAKTIGVSQSTVVKFSQKVGYSGFSELKLKLYEGDISYQPTSRKTIHGSISRSDDTQVVMEKLLSSKQRSLERTVALNDDVNIQSATELLHNASKIQISGVGASSLVAKDLSYKLMKIGHAVHCEHDAHIQVANASALNENDVLVALSYSGRSREILRVAQIAKGRKAKVITISQLAPTPLDKYADIKLMTAADEEQIRSSSITARDSQLLMTDLLFIALTQQEESADQLIEQSKSAVAALKQ
ncbi:RpiR family transcriptional regulator [Vibrio orientalis CIP 102891 = ATCC 33934]|uniref:RpiR family transcriptional regulator n=1 Tax=Vibrio orientalis CIP 102891 = ATCC 33934 TaxID=675816 RepID=C9QCC9_VIBOR|nr:MurR/RpiR family transcriptional regulator [Vibrio orientalis]EEX95448.1 transcriptional regulator RpiR family [Vibrio orientalis CIP 102891 = ATCC 33934]EGU49852.1 RpiR family transcriptional regulator [Vibrio orientalis CIP 102891 = ATCC 33934]